LCKYHKNIVHVNIDIPIHWLLKINGKKGSGPHEKEIWRLTEPILPLNSN